ncbi:hypothetical protein ACSNOJ_03620 [Streptomyces sp. URMC 128]|uniref:hypothetical protein n=1 Tax=Streptomyces sp. URMC 128 TaxID=3423404 RepID=UPI003F1A7BAC
MQEAQSKQLRRHAWWWFLAAGDLSGGQVDDRLVVHEKFIAGRAWRRSWAIRA